MMMRPLSAARPFASPRSRGSSKPAFATSPSSSTGGTAFAPQPAVTVQDASGNTVTSSGASVDLSITTPGGATLTCTDDPKGSRIGCGHVCGLHGRPGRDLHLDRGLEWTHERAQRQLHHHRRSCPPVRLHHLAVRLHCQRRLWHSAPGDRAGCRRQHGDHEWAFGQPRHHASRRWGRPHLQPEPEKHVLRCGHLLRLQNQRGGHVHARQPQAVSPPPSATASPLPEPEDDTTTGLTTDHTRR